MSQTAAESHPIDVRKQQVARVYAEALLNAAVKAGKSLEVMADLDSLVNELFRDQPMLEKALGSGAIRRDRKRTSIDHAFGGRAEPIVVDFLQVLNNHERLDHIRAVQAAYRALMNERAKRKVVKVKTAVALTDEQQDRLTSELKRTFDFEPMLDARVDPELLGGMIVQVGDWLFDSSVKTRLERLRNQLMASSQYVQDRRDQFSTAG